MNTISKYLNLILQLDCKYFVDIGASCLTEESQSEILLSHGWSGLMFECDLNKFNIQSQKIQGKNATVLSTKVNVDNILEILENNNVPDGFYLSVDIDGYDYFVIEKILSKYRPSLIISEINEKIPAGIKFSVNYDPDYFWDGSHYYGYSLSMLEDLLSKYQYKIHDLDYNNVILIPGKQEEKIDFVYENGYLNKMDRKNLYYWNSDFEPVYSMTVEEQLSFIRNKFFPFINDRQVRPGYQIDGKQIHFRNFILEI